MRRLTAILVSVIALGLGAAAPAAGFSSGSVRPEHGHRPVPPPTQVAGHAPGSGRPVWLICALCAGAIGVAMLPPGRPVPTRARPDTDPWSRALRRGPRAGNGRRPVAGG
jgi:hypothetical protein